MISAINHITINVKNLEKSLEFYGELLGLEPMPSVTTDIQKVYYFALPGGVKLELIDYFDDIEVAECSELALGTCRHFAFTVDDINAVCTKLESAGYKFHLPVAYNEDFDCTAGLVMDPNGFEIEFVQG